jgi:hypothetical protein
MCNPTINQSSRTEAMQFAERALLDFGLEDAFRMRSPQERDQCLDWLIDAATPQEEEERVSCILDCLWFAAPLPGTAATSLSHVPATVTA